MKGDIPYLLIGGPFEYEVVIGGPNCHTIETGDPQGIHGTKSMDYVYAVKKGTDEAHYVGPKVSCWCPDIW